MHYIFGLARIFGLSGVCTKLCGGKRKSRLGIASKSAVGGAQRTRTAHLDTASVAL